jgi:hypothetical protein
MGEYFEGVFMKKQLLLLSAMLLLPTLAGCGGFSSSSEKTYPLEWVEREIKANYDVPVAYYYEKVDTSGFGENELDLFVYDFKVFKFDDDSIDYILAVVEAPKRENKVFERDELDIDLMVYQHLEV